MSQSQPWVVVKFGGTSVSSLARWHTIAEVIRTRRAQDERVLVVCSALSQVSNLLEDAVRLAPSGGHGPVLQQILDKHQALADAMQVDLQVHCGELLGDLERLLLGASLLGEVSPRQHARVLSAGELLSTRLGAAWLREQGLDVAWMDARESLTSVDDARRPERARYLQATVDDAVDPTLQARLHTGAPVALTQGFIARNPARHTVLLGRGGSDTSAALFAARLGAVRCEIWTDVPGMFTANPRQVPDARLLLQLGYDEAQEIASTGAKVLHPRCVPPVRRHNIPLEVRCTERPELPGTRISGDNIASGPRVHAISARTGITLIRIDTLGMWQQVGFLADVFACFKARGLSVDLVSTSETNVTVTLDPSDTAVDPGVIEALLTDLRHHGRAQAIHRCAAVSLVGRRIRGLVHRLGPALEVFEEQHVHLITQAASDLNLTFVVDEGQSDRLVTDLHNLLFTENHAGLGPRWRQLFDEGVTSAPQRRVRWWEAERESLIALAAHGPRYVLHGPSIDKAATGLLGLGNVDRVLYAMKANPHPDVLRRLVAHGIGLECVSTGELDHAFATVSDLDPDRVLFTPNFAPRAEYEAAFARGVHVTLDNLHPLEAWPEVFRGRAVQVRLDPGTGKGHHDHVRTAGSRSKFGIAADQVDRLHQLTQELDVTVEGLHAHSGSGIRTPEHWAEVARFLTRMRQRFPQVRRLDLGGGLGVPEKPGDSPLDLDALDASLAQLKQAHPDVELWLEPGRYLVALAGVLLARVTQLKRKGDRHFVGVDTGMNSLIRPALYGAWHDIVNLSRWGEAPAMTASVVGPICESGDTLGRERLLPQTHEGDVLLVDVTGAYGRSMSSRYNLREPADEVVLG